MKTMGSNSNFRLQSLDNGDQGVGRNRSWVRYLLIVGIGLLAVTVIASVVLDTDTFFGSGNVQAESATTESVPITDEIPIVPAAEERVVTADAVIVPQEYASLSMPTGGIVDEILAAEGDIVEKGQLILRLRNSQQQAAVAQAEAEVQIAKARFEELRAGARLQEIASAQADVDAAKARLAKLQEGPRSEAIGAERASLEAVRAELAQLYRGPTENERIAAEAELANAEAERNVAQSAYNKVSFRNDVGQLPESLRLQEATNKYNAAKARYDALFVGPNPDAIAKAQANIRQAQADLDILVAPATQNEIAEAEADLRRFESALELLTAGTRQEALIAAQADVAKAEAALSLAKADLFDTKLRAPFAGTLAAIDVKIGEQIVVGTPVVQLADLSTWQIETEDMTELDVVYVYEGDQVFIKFDAIDALELTGSVVRIKPIGKNREGDITYTAIIQPDQHDSRLRWNMTASVTIQ